MMAPSGGTRCGRKSAIRRGRAVLRAMAAKPALDEPRLDQLFTEPIVQQFMHRDRIDEATTRRLEAAKIAGSYKPMGALGPVTT